MAIALFGATGTIGSRILDEALARGHKVTVVARDPAKIAARAGVTVVAGDALDPASIAAAVKGHDAVISAFGPGHHNDPSSLPVVARALIAGLNQAGVKRLLIVSGAGSLEVAPGVKLFDTPTFPDAYQSTARAHADALAVFKADTTLDWSALSPSALIAPGERTGKFRLGGNQLIVDAEGNSRISCEDYAIALVDELEKPAHIRQRFTAGY